MIGSHLRVHILLLESDKIGAYLVWRMKLLEIVQDEHKFLVKAVTLTCALADITVV